MEKTGRKCSQLDCDLRPYEQLCIVLFRLQVNARVRWVAVAGPRWPSLLNKDAQTDKYSLPESITCTHQFNATVY